MCCILIKFFVEINLDRDIEFLPAVESGADFVIWFYPSTVLFEAIFAIVALGFLPDCVLAVNIFTLAKLELNLMDECINQTSQFRILNSHEWRASVLG